MVGFKDMLISVILIGIFMFAIFSFGINFAEDNETNISITDHSAISKGFTNITKQLEDISDDAEGQQTSFFKDIPIIGELSLILKSVTGVTRVFFNSVVSFFTSFIELLSTTLGIPPIITGGITSIILITMILLAWKVYRTGQ